MHLFVISVLMVFGFPFIMTAVVGSFSTCSEVFLDELPPVVNGFMDNAASKEINAYQRICQLYKNAYRFATLYDTTNKIPVFSAYRYTGSFTEEPKLPWMIEPQLEAFDAEMREPCVNQADIDDYWKNQNLARSQLFPNSHAADRDTAESTFTLTNVVPQYGMFYSQSWMRMEERVRGIMDSHCRDKENPNNVLAYVLTGAVPSPRNLLNTKVNIPSFMWTVFCCYNHKTEKWESQAHWGENKQSNTININAKDLKRLQEFLQKKYGSQSILFNDKCQDFLQVTN